MEKIVPLISAGTAGPLGLSHLPRLWLKVLLHATGRLPGKSYRHGSAGLDELMLDTIGVNLAEFLEFVSTKLPTYIECEKWVREHATKLDKKTIDGWNELLRSRDKPVVQLGPQWKYIGIDDPSIRGTILVNDLDDWQTVYLQVTKGKMPLIAASLHSELTELLAGLLKEVNADRTAIRVDLPQWEMTPKRPLTEARRSKDIPSTLERDVTDPQQLGPIEYIARENKIVVTEDMMSADAMIAKGSDMVTKYATRARMIGPVISNGKLVAWITVHVTGGPRKWREQDVAALKRSSERARELIESVEG